MFKKLKEMREYEGLSQQEVADYLQVKRSTYAGWECGKDIIPFRKLNQLANLYHTSLDYLVENIQEIEIVNVKQDIDVNTVSNNLKEFRNTKGITQKEFAKVLKTSQSNIHKYETGKCLITTTYVIEFSKQYHYSLDQIAGRKK